MTAPVLIFAIGNESRGDDALGPLLLREIGSWLNPNNPLAPEVVIPAKAGIQLIEKSPQSGATAGVCPLRGMSDSLDSRLRGNDSSNGQSGLNSGEEKCPQRFELLEDFQLQIEHAMDMKDRKRVLFIDAGMDTPAPFSFNRAKPSGEPVLYSHALAPQALLDVYAQVYEESPPAAYILCIKGESFELGEAPTPTALKHLALALDFVKQSLLDDQSWDDLLTEVPV
jgi:hypothetical protein